MTQNDRLFLETVQGVAKNNRDTSPGITPKAIITTKSLLSPELLELFDVGSNDAGAWFFNVYVSFQPMFIVTEAESWQK